jgi:hypothetical protein
VLYLHIKLRTSNSNCSLVKAVRLKAKRKFSHGRQVAALYSKKVTLTKAAYFPILYYRTLFQNPTFPVGTRGSLPGGESAGA